LPLRLALTRGALGIELNRPEPLGPLEIAELTLSLPDLRYPLDLSRGVKQFRNRRGRLQRVLIKAPLLELGAWLQECWSEVLGEPLAGVRLWRLGRDRVEGAAAPIDPLDVNALGLGVGLYSRSRSLAFDLLWFPQQEPGWLLVRPRGVGLEVASLALALRALDAVVERVCSLAASLEGPLQRRGRWLALRAGPEALVQVLLPAFGFRVPDTSSLLPGPLEVREGVLEFAFDSEHEAPELPREVLLAREAALQSTAADDALARGEEDAARAALLELLSGVGALVGVAGPSVVAGGERSGLVAVASALAELDLAVPGRQEAALATLQEIGGPERAGVLGAQALVAAGHVEGARDALVRAAEAEPFGPLAAQVLCRAAQLAEQVAFRVACLDRAVARCPQLPSARWFRFEDRVRRGDVEGALADAQHLEAAANSAVARHAVCLRAGRRLAEADQPDLARRFLERALRYGPDDPVARAALGRVFASLGLRSRALSLLQSALRHEPPFRGGSQQPHPEEPTPAGDTPAASGVLRDVERDELLLDLARLLGDGLDDLPQAIARLRQISARSARAVDARALEADYRERLGDLAGASRAYARLREAVELGWTAGHEALAALVRGAHFEEGRGELATAERHLYAAVSLAPSDEQIRAEYRRVAALVARK
jgi:tetratricopeptide (TPR) repeat protein